MADRMLEIIAPSDKKTAIEETLTTPTVVEVWYDESTDVRCATARRSAGVRAKVKRGRS